MRWELGWSQDRAGMEVGIKPGWGWNGGQEGGWDIAAMGDRMKLGGDPE